MRHGAGQAILIDGEDVHRQIAENVVRVHVCFERGAFRDVLQGSDNALLVLSADLRDCAIPDGGVAVHIIIDVVQIRAVAAGEAESAESTTAESTTAEAAKTEGARGCIIAGRRRKAG